MQLINNIADIRKFVMQMRNDGKTVALVPTMGALHDGHLSLVKAAQKQCDVVIVSIFVNPTQFAPNEDFDSYPRTIDEDSKKLSSISCDAVYTPSVSEMYHGDRATSISVSGVSGGLCGGVRSGHFDGVALIVTKLLLQVKPDSAYFGEKDYQQLQVIKRFAYDLDIDCDIVGVPIFRDKNTGLALSSRNIYLSDNEKKIANNLNKILFTMSEQISNGSNIVDIQRSGLKQMTEAGFDNIDYLEICGISDLKPVTEKNGKELRILVAAKIGKTRLIDNVSA